MKRGPLFVLAAIAALAWAVVDALRCLRRGQHDPVRGPLGLRCARCHEPLSDYGEAGTMSDGYVDMRTRFGRERGEGITREWMQ